MRRSDYRRKMKKLKNLRHKRTKQLLKNSGPAERRVAAVLRDAGIPFGPQKGVLIGAESLRVADFYIKPPFNFFLEIDGKYHDNPAQRERDAGRTREMLDNSSADALYRLTDDDVMRGSEDDLSELLIDMCADHLKKRGKNRRIQKKSRAEARERHRKQWHLANS